MGGGGGGGRQGGGEGAGRVSVVGGIYDYYFSRQVLNFNTKFVNYSVCLLKSITEKIDLEIK